MKARDERVNINSEVLSSMKTVKIQAWEEPFAARIMEYRGKELKELLRYWVYSSATAMIWNGTVSVCNAPVFWTWQAFSFQLLTSYVSPWL